VLLLSSKTRALSWHLHHKNQFITTCYFPLTFCIICIYSYLRLAICKCPINPAPLSYLSLMESLHSSTTFWPLRNNNHVTSSEFRSSFQSASSHLALPFCVIHFPSSHWPQTKKLQNTTTPISLRLFSAKSARGYGSCATTILNVTAIHTHHARMMHIFQSLCLKKSKSNAHMSSISNI
jgi:hypothetical protein